MPILHPIAYESALLLWALLLVFAAASIVSGCALYFGRPR